MKYFIHLPMKMEPIVSSETSAIRTQTPGNYPKRNNLRLYIIVIIELKDVTAFKNIILVINQLNAQILVL